MSSLDNYYWFAVRVGILGEDEKSTEQRLRKILSQLVTDEQLEDWDVKAEEVAKWMLKI